MAYTCPPCDHGKHAECIKTNGHRWCECSYPPPDKGNLEQVRQLFRHNEKETVMPILHNPDHIFLLVYGWGIRLSNDGTWTWEETSGG